MDLKETHTFTAPLADVFALQTDAAFLVTKLSAIGNEDVTVTESAATPDGGHRVVVKMTVSADLPGFAAKVLPSRTPITQTYLWGPPSEGRRSGTWKTESATPVTATGTMSLESVGEQTKETIAGTVKCAIPLLGGKIADFVGNSARKTIAEDRAFTDAHLAS